MKRIYLVLFMASLCAAQRLPQSAVPESYTLHFTPDLAKNNFEGDETIQLQLRESGSQIVLNAVDIDFHEVTIGSGGNTQTAQVTSDKTKQTAMKCVDFILAKTTRGENMPRPSLKIPTRGACSLRSTSLPSRPVST
jgi:aminopeptidase N